MGVQFFGELKNHCVMNNSKTDKYGRPYVLIKILFNKEKFENILLNKRVNLIFIFKQNIFKKEYKENFKLKKK